MNNRSDMPTRIEVTDTVDLHQNEMNDKGEEIELTVSDLELERETLEALERRGTAEGTDEIEQNIDTAQDVSGGEFEEESHELEEVHSETEEHETDLNERSESATMDQAKIADAQSAIHSDNASGELERAREAAEQDIEFLTEHEQRSEQARQESEQLHQEHENRASQARR